MTISNEPDLGNTSGLTALLRDEMAVVKTYTQAMVNVDAESIIVELQTLRDEHSRAIRELRDCVVRFGTVPTEQMDPSSVTASAPVGIAKSINSVSTLSTLQKCEEGCIQAYEAALVNDAIPPGGHAIIRTTLLPACRKHLVELKHLIDDIKN